MTIYNSFSELENIKRRDLFDKNGNLKKNLNRKMVISIARIISDGFDHIDLRKPVKDNDYYRARRVIILFYQTVSYEKIKVIRPAKHNRKIYAEYNQTNSKFKYYAVPAHHDADKFKVTGKGKNKRIKRIGIYANSEFYKFPSRRNLVLDPEKETKLLYNRIDKKYKNKKYAVKIKCGRAEYKTLYKKKDPHKEIAKWINEYGAENVKKWCLGFQVYTFSNQKVSSVKPLLKKTDKRKNRKKFKK